MTIDHNKLKANREGNRRQTKGWRPREGDSKVRILPPHSKFLDNWDTMDHLAVKFEVHFFNIEGRKTTEVSRCLADLRQRCPACAVSRAYKDSEDPGLKDMAKRVRSASQYLFNILDMNNLQAGIQQWSANYTCWDKIIEIGAKPAWGNIVDPADGVDFTITLTPANRSKTQHNQYSVIPDPQRTNVMPVLEAIEGWKGLLDTLDSQITEAKSAEEIVALLEEMGFSTAGIVSVPAAVRPVGSAPAPTPVAARPASVAPAPTPAVPAVAAPVPVSSAPKPIAVPVPVPTAPAPVAVPTTPVTEERSRPNVASVLTPPVAVGASVVHYDPGPEYAPVVADEDRPVGVPRCFGDYEPKRHRCQPCPVLADCQMKMLGI